MDGPKVVSLDGAPLPQPGQPNERAVDLLRRLLEQAESGKIIGVSAAVLHDDKWATYYVGGMVGGFSMLGAVDCMHHELVKTALGHG